MTKSWAELGQKVGIFCPKSGLILPTFWPRLLPRDSGQERFPVSVGAAIDVVTNVVLLVLLKDIQGQAFHNDIMGTERVIDVVLLCKELPIVFQINQVETNVVFAQAKSSVLPIAIVSEGLKDLAFVLFFVSEVEHVGCVHCVLDHESSVER